MNKIGVVVFLTLLAVQCGEAESLRGLGRFFSFQFSNLDVGSFFQLNSVQFAIFFNEVVFFYVENVSYA